MQPRSFVSRFSPNRTDPDVLEAIFVQRHELAGIWAEKLRDSILTKSKHNLLAVGPRGCGKSHLVALLVNRLRKDQAISNQVRIAWLPEDETTPSFWKFLLRVLRALNAEYGDEIPLPDRKQLNNIDNEHRSQRLIDYLIKALDSKTLLIVVENLDDVMQGLKVEGQKRLRALLQESETIAVLATAQHLTKDISSRERPFFNFFQIEHLMPLSADDALTLLRKIACYTSNDCLLSFLNTPTGRARIRAIRHLTGGSHRVFIILSEFASRENLDDLVVAFEELLDELTPFYQERIRSISDQQREIIELLCRFSKTFQVKEIAEELFLSEQTAASQLKILRDKGYVVSHSRGRESRYELSEPLMRLCVEVKDPQREPIRLIVEFLSVWYDRASLEARLNSLPDNAKTERLYFDAAIQSSCLGGSPPIEAALNRDLETAREQNDANKIMQILTDLAATSESSSACLYYANQLLMIDSNESLIACERALTLDGENSLAWLLKSVLLNERSEHEKALEACERSWVLNSNNHFALLLKGIILDELRQFSNAIGIYKQYLKLEPSNYMAWNNIAKSYIELGMLNEAIIALDKSIENSADNTMAWLNKGFVLDKLGRHRDAVRAYDEAIKINPSDSLAWSNKGSGYGALGEYEKALNAFDKAIELDPGNSIAWNNRGHAYLDLGRVNSAIDNFNQAILIDNRCLDAIESLAVIFSRLGQWDDVEQLLAKRFAVDHKAEKWHLNEIIETIFTSSNSEAVWKHHINMILNIVNQESQKRSLDKSATRSDSLQPESIVGEALVNSLRTANYMSASFESISKWLSIWQEVATRYPKYSLAVRLYTAGLLFQSTNDEKILLDLVQEERKIIQDLFSLKSK